MTASIMEKHPLVSICIPTYNGAQFLTACLDSVLAQTFMNFEVIVVDDQSGDGTAALVETYIVKDPRIRFYKNEKNLGLVGNWNKCLELAQGEWIKFVFQDDYISSNCLEEMLHRGGDHQLVVCSRKFIFEKNVPSQTVDYYSNKLVSLQNLQPSLVPFFLTPGEVAAYALKNIALNFIGEPTSVLFRKDMISKVGYFNPKLSQICDLEYWLRIASRYGMVYVPEALAFFRIHGDSASTANTAGKNNFKVQFSDPILLCYNLLSASCFEYFRSCMSWFGKLRLKYYIRLKFYEAGLKNVQVNQVNEDLLRILLFENPALKHFNIHSLVVKTGYYCIKLKRRFLR